VKLIFNIQMFADTSNKTEKATPRKKQEARKKGMVSKSREMTSALTLLFSIIVLKQLATFSVNSITSFTKYSFMNLTINIEDSAELFQFLKYGAYIIFKAILPMIAVVFIIAILSELFQTGFLLTTETLKISFQKINPIEGFKRIFSINSVMELIKSILKVLIIGWIGYTWAKSFIEKILLLSDMELKSTVLFSFNSIMDLMLWMAFMFFVIAFIDYIFQRRQYEKKLMMTKEEVKEEFKQTEGNPQIKSRIRETQRKISLRRMFQQLPKADVVITNPTHYAVAILYEPEKYDAPRVIAKGKDFVAMKIKEEAKKYGIRIVENKPLAQSLYNLCDVGEFIPQELYQAVAEVLAYIYSLDNYQKVNMK